MFKRPALKLTLFALSFASYSAASAAPPTTVRQAICRPIFHADGETFSAGTAFVLDLPKPAARSLLVSALHVFGPDGGLAKQIPAAELAQRASVVECRALASAETWHAGRALTIADARPLEPGYLKDVSAFILDSSTPATHPTHLRLAAAPPKAGDAIWLLAQVLEGAPGTELLHRAVVRSSKDEALQYEFDNASLKLQATSGAPLLDVNGDVVGINIGAGASKGKVIGVGDSLASLRSLLSSAR
jgi:hypothetical protein